MAAQTIHDGAGLHAEGGMSLPPSVRPSLVPLPVLRCCWTVLELQATLWDDPLHIQNKELS